MNHNGKISFKRNSWIFGYGLDYRFLSILQKEASVSSVDLDGKNEVKADFLLGDNNFTVIVELKRPDTSLFEKDKNRSEVMETLQRLDICSLTDFDTESRMGD